MELKDVLGYLGYKPDEVKDLDGLKEKFDADFVKKSTAASDKDVINAVTGKFFNTYEQKTGKIAKDLGIDISGDEFKDLQKFEKRERVIELYKESKEKEIGTLTDQLKSNDVTKVVADWEDKYKKLESKQKQTSDLLESLKQENEKVKKEATETVSSYKKNQAWSGALGSIKFSKEVDTLKKTGFETLLKNKYKIELDEAGKEYIADTNGERIKSKKKAGSFMDINEVFEMEAIENKLVDLTPEQKKTGTTNSFSVFGNTENKATTTNQPEGRYKRSLHPAAQK